jgi:uroporphyrin-III C-methyltransferase/precorrin-2 dehydrogenase/sirohydrochlorin ferrochelatase
VKYPVFLDLRGRVVLLVGAGRTAWQKWLALEGTGAQVRVVAPETGSGFKDLLQATTPPLVHFPRTFQETDLHGVFLVLVTTPCRTTNHQIALTARQQGILVNVADDPEFCDFHIPALVRRPPLQLALGSEGQSPALVRLLKRYLEEELLTEDLAQLAAQLGAERAHVQSSLPTFQDRRRFWYDLLASQYPALLADGHPDQARAELHHHLQTAGEQSQPLLQVSHGGEGG